MKLFNYLSLFILFKVYYSFNNWDENIFNIKIENALKSINQVLNNNKNPTYAENIPHSYDDKFTLVEYLVNIALSSHKDSLLSLGISEEQLNDLTLSASQNKTIILKFFSTEKCTFLREELREEEDPRRIVEEGRFFKTTTKVVTMIKEYFWNFELSSEIKSCVKGGGFELCKTLISYEKSQTLKTNSEKSPRPNIYQIPSIDLDLTWFFQQLLQPKFPSFKINRLDKKCYTPVRNDDSLSTIDYFDSFINWGESIELYYENSLYSLESLWLSNNNQGVKSILSDLLEKVTIPVVPVMLSLDIEDEKENKEETKNNENKKSPLFLNDFEINICLLEEERTLLEAKKNLEILQIERQKSSILSLGHLEGILIIKHMNEVSLYLINGILSVERMLKKQLISAIGREVTPNDVSDYMKLRGQQLFLPEFRPSPMNYVIRRSSNHSVEGILSIERSSSSFSSSSSYTNPTIHTIVRKELMSTSSSKSLPSSSIEFSENNNNNNNNNITIIGDKNIKIVDAMSFVLNDATKVKIVGDRFIHSYLHHQFGVGSDFYSNLNLIVRARQFSSFIMVLGVISSSSSFDPLQAMIIQNKDEIKIPLNLEFIPSIKEFRRAISSLSPEQKKFAEAIRELQMSNTLFGICIIQIKPQLEKVLNLPEDSLTKEIGLTEDLLKLFIEYQIPSDLLSYDELLDSSELIPNSITTSQSAIKSIEKVREHVQTIQKLIQKVRDEELKKKKEEDEYYNRDKSENVKPSAHYAELSSERRMKSGFRPQTLLMTKSANLRSVQDSPPAQFDTMSAQNIDAGINNNLESQFETESIPDDTNSRSESESVKPLKSSSKIIDLSSLPYILQDKFDKYGTSDSIRPGIVRAGDNWKRKRQENFFSSLTESNLGVDNLKSEKQRAFDLLDALTRSGGLSVDHSSIHVFMTSAHCFEDNLLNTLIQKNINPMIELEKSTLLMASVIHEKEIKDMLMN